MTTETLKKANELCDKRDYYLAKLQEIQMMRERVKNQDIIWVAVGSASSNRSTYINTGLVNAFLAEADKFYTEKKLVIENEFAKL